jgi:hypothetical protein
MAGNVRPGGRFPVLIPARKVAIYSRKPHQAHDDFEKATFDEWSEKLRRTWE